MSTSAAFRVRTKIARRNGRGKRDQNLWRPEVHDFVITRMETYGNSQGPIPERLTLLRPDPGNSSSDLLFLDQLPIPRDAWRYDRHDRVLTWQGAYGGGHLYLSHDGSGATGNIGPAHQPCSVTAGSRAQFDCDVALDCGATYESSGGSVVGFHWDPTSAEWKGATWIPHRLLLTYTVTPGSNMVPPEFSFEFEDVQTGALPWDPVPQSFGASLQLGEQGGMMVWNLSFKSYAPPDPDRGFSPPQGPDSVYPSWMLAVEDAAAARINGVLEIDKSLTTGQGTLVGMQGVRATAAATGYYQTSPNTAPFGVFDGRLVIGGQPVAGSRVSGNFLRWSNLDPALQARTGLPASGSLKFNRDGSTARSDQGPITVRRLRTTAAIDAIARHSDLHPGVHQRGTVLRQTLSATALDIYGLLAMTPFKYEDGAWSEVVQEAVTDDLSEIMNSFIPPDMWNLLFPDLQQPGLTGELATVANTPVSGVDDPKDWYGKLSTAVLTQGLANGSDPNCHNLNGPRAAAWLQTQVATSQVYYTHGQLLFQYEWQQQNPLTSDYLIDQVSNAAAYAPMIDAQIQATINDINANVITDASSPPNLKADMIAEAQATGQYAKTNNLYWAFAYYTYNTASGILANIANQMSYDTGSSDGTTLARLFQQNVAVLTALDPSGYFAQQYVTTINTFLATNILPTMFGFLSDATSFDLIKEYLQQFVDKNLNNEEQDIADAAKQIQAILQDENADRILHDSIDALVNYAAAISDTMAFPYVAHEYQQWFSARYPKFSSAANLFGSLFIGGAAGLAIFSLFVGFKSWDELDDMQKTELILQTTQLGLQIVSAVVKRGARIYVIFNTGGMTAAGRRAAVGRIIATGGADALNEGLLKFGNSAARWLADTAGTGGRVWDATNSAQNYRRIDHNLILTTGVEAKEASWAGKVFGRNLDEFISTRIGPLVILAAIGMSCFRIASGAEGAALAANIVNIVGGSLMLFALVGSWAVKRLVVVGYATVAGILSGILTTAGVLAILAALAGVALVLYEKFTKPPDPVEEFVNKYAKPNFYVTARASSIDYATSFINPDQGNLEMVGFSLSASGQALVCQPDGTITLGTVTALPDCVWQVSTDGLGLSTISTIAQPDPTEPPVSLLLSLMSDNSVSFQPPMPAPLTSPSASATTTPTVLTQTWLSAPQGHASLTKDGKYMTSLQLTFQPVLPDSSGNYAPSQASRWLVQTTTGVGTSDSGGTVFMVSMSGMAPNYMRMVDLWFLLNSTPSTSQSYGPAFGVYPSNPTTYATGGDLPPFLTFDTQGGKFMPNGKQATTASQTSNTISASNSVGAAQASFSIKVASPPPPPPV